MGKSRGMLVGLSAPTETGELVVFIKEFLPPPHETATRLLHAGASYVCGAENIGGATRGFSQRAEAVRRPSALGPEDTKMNEGHILETTHRGVYKKIF